MKRIVLIALSVALIATLSACGKKVNPTPSTSTTPGVSEPSSTQQTSIPESDGQPVIVKMADGSEKTAVFFNGFYQFETNSSVKVLELAYLHDQPGVGTAELKLVYEGDAENAVALLVPKHIVHGDYQIAEEYREDTIETEKLNQEGLYGIDGNWQMPSTCWDYEIRVFDAWNGNSPVELAFVPLAAQVEVKIGELTQLKTASTLKVNGLTLDKTEYKDGDSEEITGRLDADGFGDEAWIGIVPSGVPHGDDERNDTYDSDYEYLSALENGKFALTIPESAGTYDLRINDGTVEIAYMSIVVK